MEKKREYIRDGRAPIPKDESTSKIMSAIKDKNTQPEIILRKALWHSGLKGYRKHWDKVPGRPDIAYPGKRIAIFVNGCFWHRCPHCNLPLPKTNRKFWEKKFERNVKRDEMKLKQLNDSGWETVVVWECQIKKDLEKSVQKVKKFYLNG